MKGCRSSERTTAGGELGLDARPCEDEFTAEATTSGTAVSTASPIAAFDTSPGSSTAAGEVFESTAPARGPVAAAETGTVTPAGGGGGRDRAVHRILSRKTSPVAQPTE
ncbi:hypothetical protein CP967_24480 [Streptomyces nitrosporeus]|uniref:Uncharacterized protein n=1 Tax=Streptomyces nitrosporeus TaxID=28894 RepID=A0A5J6FF71_9ACTN|nr:hypothetical protein [Streptomyces nitrosporeus]QEU74721.1 hypothetical protein CP967_24480 [Streptomyces nitrosporeus]GGY85423.1 hypothetical protein GCM10010327_14900 [Streptomyces nitrosporeus]